MRMKLRRRMKTNGGNLWLNYASWKMITSLKEVSGLLLQQLCGKSWNGLVFLISSLPLVFVIPELPLFLGENVLGRDPNTCTLSLPSPSISKQHATISISVYRRRGRPSEAEVEALVWDLGSLNGTRKGRLKLTPNVRYALSECDSLVLADIPCQYVSSSADKASPRDQFKTPMSRGSGAKATLADASNENGSGNKKCVNGASESRVGLPNVDDRGETPVRSCLSFEQTPTQPQGTLVPESDLDSDDEGGGRGDWRHKTLGM